jgi:hypothetical protein
MTPEGDPGVSDFGISVGQVASGGPRQSSDGSGNDPRFDLAAAVRRITSAMVSLPLADGDITAATADLAQVADRRSHSGCPGFLSW